MRGGGQGVAERRGRVYGKYRGRNKGKGGERSIEKWWGRSG